MLRPELCLQAKHSYALLFFFQFPGFADSTSFVASAFPRDACFYLQLREGQQPAFLVVLVFEAALRSARGSNDTNSTRRFASLEIDPNPGEVPIGHMGHQVQQPSRDIGVAVELISFHKVGDPTFLRGICD